MTREELQQQWEDKKRQMAIQQIRSKEAPFRDSDGFVVMSAVITSVTSLEAFEALFQEAIQIG